MPRPLPSRLLAGAVALGAVGVVGGCASSASSRTDANYCATVRRHLTELTAPSIATPSDVTKAVAMYTSIAAVAPLAVEKEWDVLTLAYQTAATVVPGDQASMQKATDTIRAAQQSATAAADYTRRLCAVDIGPPGSTTIAAPDAAATTTSAG